MEPQPLFICFSEAPMLGLGHFVDDYLLDFDIYHVSHVTELVMYIDAKYLSRELGRSVGSLNEVIIPVPGGSGAVDLETWFYVQHSVDSFIDRCSQLARSLANFIKIIQQEDISQLENYDCMREVEVVIMMSPGIMLSPRSPTRTGLTTDN